MLTQDVGMDRVGCDSNMLSQKRPETSCIEDRAGTDDPGGWELGDL
jgi:hypothetical protein